AEIGSASFLWTKVELAGKIENVHQRQQGDGGTDEERHNSVSLLAWLRNCASSAPRTGRRPSASAGAGRFLHERTTKTTVIRPNAIATKGTIHAVRLKPVMVGSARTVGPYFWTNAF